MSPANIHLWRGRSRAITAIHSGRFPWQFTGYTKISVPWSEAYPVERQCQGEFFMSTKTYHRGVKASRKGRGSSTMAMLLCLSALFLHVGASRSVLAQAPRLTNSDKTDIQFILQ